MQNRRGDNENSVQDSLYNWLTIKVVSDARPEDIAAAETEKMFLSILKEEHRVIRYYD